MGSRWCPSNGKSRVPSVLGLWSSCKHANRDIQLYCQNLSLFGKLFIDHKSVFFHVSETELDLVVC
jgi:hypothetical protein